MNPDPRSLRTVSLTAGLALAVMAFLAAFGVFGAVGALVTPGDAAPATDIGALRHHSSGRSAGPSPRWPELPSRSRFTIFGASGAVTFSALSGLVLHRLLPESAPPRPAQLGLTPLS
jgi:hypothetical protein